MAVRKAGRSRRARRMLAPDQVPRRRPGVMKPGQASACPLLEQPVRVVTPRGEVAVAPLDLPPGRRTVQGLEEGVPRQAVRLFQAGGDVPPHVDQHAAEVEDDPADARSSHSGRFGRGLHDAVR